MLIRPLKMAAELDEAVHLWTADTDGCIHILCNARCSNDNVSMKWREGDGRQASIVCSNKHVCGIDAVTNCLAVRTGVAHDSPIGKKWSLSSQEINKLAIGLKYLAVLTMDERTLTCMIPDYIVRDAIELEFTEIPSFPTDIVHIIMDTKDVLYSVSSFGEVHVCRDISKDGSQLHWEFFTKPPSIARRGGFLSSLFASNKILFIDVATFDEQIFFLRAEPQEIWQLVVTEILFGDKTQYKSSWNCFKFKPHSPKLSLITTNPLSKQELFGVSENGNTIMALDLQGKFITITEMPFHGCGDIVITSLSSCHLKQDVSIPKIYPKLPKLQTCCETGDCSLCQGAVIINITDNNWERKYKDELASSIAQWRRGEEYYLPKIRHSPVNTEKQRRARKRHKTSDDAEETPPTKRPPYGIEKTPPTKRPHGIDETPPTKRPRYGIQETPPSTTSYHSARLIQDIDIVIKHDSLHNFEDIFNINFPHINNEIIECSFDLEEQVINRNGDYYKTQPQISKETKSQTSIQTQPHTSIQTQPHTSIQTQPHTSIETESQASIEAESQTSIVTESQTDVANSSHNGELVIINNKCSPDITRYYTARTKL